MFNLSNNSLHRLGQVLTRDLSYQRTPGGNDLEALWNLGDQAPMLQGICYDPRYELLADAKTEGKLFEVIPPVDCQYVSVYNVAQGTIVLDEPQFLRRISLAAGTLHRAVVCVRTLLKQKRSFYNVAELCKAIEEIQIELSLKYGADNSARRRSGRFAKPCHRNLQQRILTQDYFQKVNDNEPPEPEPTVEELLGLPPLPDKVKPRMMAVQLKEETKGRIARVCEQMVTAGVLPPVEGLPGEEASSPGSPQKGRFALTPHPPPAVIPPVYKLCDALDNFLEHQPQVRCFRA
jgi:hypothetical protein